MNGLYGNNPKFTKGYYNTSRAHLLMLGEWSTSTRGVNDQGSPNLTLSNS